MKRALTEDEKAMILRFADKLPFERAARLAEEMRRATAESTSNGSRIVFEIAGCEHPRQSALNAYEVEGKALDSDGADLTVSLYADDNGCLYELEVIRWDSRELIDPNWDTLELY